MLPRSAELLCYSVIEWLCYSVTVLLHCAESYYVTVLLSGCYSVTERLCYCIVQSYCYSVIECVNALCRELLCYNVTEWLC